MLGIVLSIGDCDFHKISGPHSNICMGSPVCYVFCKIYKFVYCMLKFVYYAKYIICRNDIQQ